MPGLKKSPGMADIDVCYGARKAGPEGVQSALRQARWRYDQTLPQRSGKLDSNRLSDFISSPEDGLDAGGQESNKEPPSPPVHDGFENVVDLPSQPVDSNGGLDIGGQSGAISSQGQESNPEQPTEDIASRSTSLPNGFASVESSLQEPAPVDESVGLNDASNVFSSCEPETKDGDPIEEAVQASPSIDEGLANLASSPPKSIPAEPFDLEESRLPPTPPTLNNSDDAGQTHNENLNQIPLLADDARNRLSSKRSGPNMTPVNQPASPPTPDPSPPRKTEKSSTLPAMEQKQKPNFLIPGSFVPSERTFGEYAGSLTESFKTAEEGQTLGSNASASPVRLPENDTLPTHWLDLTRELQAASIGLRNITVQQTPNIDSFAAFQARNAPSQYGDQQSRGVMPAHQDETSQSVRQYAEDRNNVIYKRLQEENIARHSAVSANSGAITVGIAIPSNESTPRTLKRRMKRSSLRMDTSDDDNNNKDGTTVTDSGRTITGNDNQRTQGLGIRSDQTAKNNDTNRNVGVDNAGGRTLKQRKARELDKNSILTESPLFGRSTLDDSPIFAPNIRQVSSPARIGPDASDMTALTYASLQESPTARRVSKFQADPPHKLRHVSYEDRLSRNMSVRRTSLEASPPMKDTAFQAKPAKKVMNNIAVKRTRVATSPTESPEQKSPGGTLRRSSREERLENNSSVRRTSLDQAPQSPPKADTAVVRNSFDKAALPTSPRRSMDARYLYPTTTPGSFSQFSDRTENIEIGEANGIRLYPHNNESLLVIQHGSRPETSGRDASEAPNFYDEESRSTKPIFTACIEPPTPTRVNMRPKHQVDSPLTNPRIAPEPPSFKVIPPTPERELNEQMVTRPLISVDTPVGSNSPQKRLSLMQKARRYSDIVFPNLATLRRPSNHDSYARDTHLSPLWKPQGFWDEFDSEDEYNDFEPAGSLPRGGDTSNVGEDEAQKRGMFPRAMSKRLPGFRGTGGFLQGNSLGIDRHGTNNRRHYVSTGTRTLPKRQSEEVMKSLSPNAGRVSPEHHMVKTRSLAHWMTTRKFRAKIRARRLKKEERDREKRRDKIRKSIGYRVYHNGQAS